MKEWFLELQPRERYLIAGGAVVFIILIFYLLLWEPASSKVTALKSSVEAQRAQLAWMQTASQEVKSLRGSANPSQNRRSNISLVNAVESTAQRAGLRESIARMEPQGNNKINIELRGTAFNKLMYWLGELESKHAAKIEQFSASRTKSTGEVDVRMILIRDGA